MKRTLLPSVLVFALALLAGQGELSEAAPMGTAFTYQGFLHDGGNPADGLYDLEFKAFDYPGGVGVQQGSTVTIDDKDIIDGSFAVELDFGAGVFEGDARWLEIGVRPGASTGAFTPMLPRQELTLTPYALYAQTAGGDNDWALSGNDMYAIPSGKVGIGTSTPGSTLDVTNSGGLTAISGASSWIGVYGIHKSTTGTFPGVWGETDSLVKGASGVRGKVTSTSPGSSSAGVYGINAGTGSKGIGVRGTHAGNGWGVYGEAVGPLGRGVYGNATATDSTNYGGYFKAAGKSGRGVYGEATGSTGWGVYGYASDSGFGSSQYGGFFKAEGRFGSGVYGLGKGTDARAVYGFASNSGNYSNFGGYFQAAGGSGKGVYGLATGNNGRGVWGYATKMGNVTNYGGYFQAEGNTGIGVYSEGAGTFGIGVKANGKWYDFYAAGPGVNYGYSSSIRWKSDVRAIDEPLEKVMSLRGVYFNWDAEHGGGRDVGMIAEEVGQMLPEIVGYEENGVDASGMDYGKLTPVLVEAVKALKTELDEQTKQQVKKDEIIERLGEENRALAKRLAAIESLVEQLARERRELSNETF